VNLTKQALSIAVAGGLVHPPGGVRSAARQPSRAGSPAHSIKNAGDRAGGIPLLAPVQYRRPIPTHVVVVHKAIQEDENKGPFPDVG
jgi:hypothetical protein